MQKRNTFQTIILLVVGFVVASFVLNLFVGVISGLLWLGIKLLIPAAIAIWLVRWITRTTQQRKYY
ncbi:MULTISPECIES: hypothetical protein [Enterococcus]|uniref:Uncharacterized protein n=1 Tax=Enterococcus mundtii TaxID=53346 RepID=A0A1A6G6D9_ENTMU|nr:MULTISPECIES: hypothetical protein [Enterococcus]MBE6172170.1 hypothetical protein [Enterococcus faecium]GEN19301.1 hypothetical protein LAC02_25820 [Ligilactobacillus acidipiscis]AUB54032.1 hypothetical protein EM4838_14090 [Enterococcus mundtii]MBO1085551.1 hypothetical protein [Enterococcus mundtii]MDB7087661.1 hypothetical protein [Enterococcus mundtii]